MNFIFLLNFCKELRCFLENITQLKFFYTNAGRSMVDVGFHNLHCSHSLHNVSHCRRVTRGAKSLRCWFSQFTLLSFTSRCVTLSAGHERSRVPPMLVFTMCDNVLNALQCVTLSAGHDRRGVSPLL